MTVRHMRLTFGLFMTCTGIGLLAFRALAPETAAELNDLTRLTFGALLAIVLGGVNLAKWYAGALAHQQATTPVRRPFQSGVTANQDEGPNPAFDFTKDGTERTDEAKNS
ncbi:hypothetical protein VT84_29020 [Gemmata sp. SH-PL17]|nr:hypothetical protein VT84_29020 [Gemmata sp. SH-PL17]